MKIYDFSKYLKIVSQNGNQLSGHSPFREDNSPSFSCNNESGMWKDFGTGESGNWNQFLLKLGKNTPGKSEPKNPFWENSVLVDEYIYFDSSLEPSLKVERHENSILQKKVFLQKHYANGFWNKGKPKNELCPYNFQIWKDSKDPIFFVEGEKCANFLQRKGVNSTTTSGGSSNRSLGFLKKYFADRTVFIIPDNDLPGKKYSSRVAEILFDVSSEVKIVELNGLNEAEDVFDWFKKGNTLDKLAKLCNAAPVWIKPENSSNKVQDENPQAVAEEYFTFFEHHLNKPKRDIISGELMTQVDGLWQPANSRLDILGSHAYDSYSFKKTRLKEHLARFCETKKPELLIDIPEWDGSDRVRKVSEALTLSNCSNEDFYQLFCSWGAKIFARLENPKEQNRVVILKGPQGIGKDRLISSITDGLGQFAIDLTITKNEKDTLAAIGSLIVAKISEFDRTSKTEVSTLKDLITREQTFIRKPYDKAAVARKVRCSFIASVNVDEILRDPTGNRRFIIFDIQKIDWNYPEAESLQVLAQFKHLYNANFKPSVESESRMRDYIENQTPEDPKVLLLEIFDDRISHLEKKTNKVKFGRLEIFEIVQEISKCFGLSVNQVLHTLGTNGRKTKTRDGMIYHRKLEF